MLHVRFVQKNVPAPNEDAPFLFVENFVGAFPLGINDVLGQRDLYFLRYDNATGKLFFRSYSSVSVYNQVELLKDGRWNSLFIAVKPTSLPLTLNCIGMCSYSMNNHL